MRLGRRHPNLRSFVLGSVAVHGLLLAVWATSVQFGAEPRMALSVRLDGDRETALQGRTACGADGCQTAQPRRANHAARPQAERAARAPAPVVVPASTTAPADGEHEAVPTVPAAGATKTGNDDEIRARIQSRLRLDLARHFDYPWIAQLRGWEGDVLLGVIVQASGRLDAIRVVRSSGFAVLDRSAVDSLRKVERIPEAVAWLRGRDLEMHLPVVYRLEGK